MKPERSRAARRAETILATILIAVVAIPLLAASIRLAMWILGL